MVHALGRAVRTAGCIKCRSYILRTFTEGIARNLVPVSGQLHVYSRRTRRYSQSLQQPDLFSRKVAASQEIETLSEDGGEEYTLNEALKEEAEIQSDDAPWYLNVEAPSRRMPSLSDRQRIPDLPESPPDILQPLLQRLSIDLGLDNLSLLDLRKLDPPPALGANLIMIVGTARSEKHLHVSADRLCRWLRSEYTLRPHADGLLGRGELQLKLKRKARRSKLLGNTKLDEDFDDGIRTGWVCVNVGTVKTVADEALKDAPSGVEGFVGFGRQMNGVKIVVQMLIEEKRQEIDLESLWNGIARRQATPIPEPAEQSEDPLLLDFDGSRNTEKNPRENSSTSTFAAARHTSYSPASSSLSSQAFQFREYHSTTRVSSEAVATNLESMPAESFEPKASNVVRCTDLKALTQSVGQVLRSDDYTSAKQLVLDHRDSLIELQNEAWRPFFLHCLLDHLQKLPKDKALAALGRKWVTRPTTPFLLCFSQTRSTFPPPAELEAIVQLYCIAMERETPYFRQDSLLAAVKLYHFTAGVLPDGLYKKVFHALLKSSVIGPPRDDRLQAVSAVLQDMQERGHNLLTVEIFLSLQEGLAVLPEGTPDPSKFIDLPNADIMTWNLPTLTPNHVQSDLHTAMTALHLPFSSDALRIRLLDIYAKQHFWVEFWDFWRLQARERRPRSAALYSFMFRQVAATDHQQGCMMVLRTWVSEMDGEDPPVELQGEVLDAVEECLEVADHGGQVLALGWEAAKGEWAPLWRRCAAARGWVAPWDSEQIGD